MLDVSRRRDGCPPPIQPQDGCRGVLQIAGQDYIVDRAKEDRVCAEDVGFGDAAHVAAQGAFQYRSTESRRYPILGAKAPVAHVATRERLQQRSM